MSIKVFELIEKLKEKDQNDDVEFVVCKTNGELVCVDIERQARALSDLLNMFGS